MIGAATLEAMQRHCIALVPVQGQWLAYQGSLTLDLSMVDEFESCLTGKAVFRPDPPLEPQLTARFYEWAFGDTAECAVDSLLTKLGLPRD